MVTLQHNFNALIIQKPLTLVAVQLSSRLYIDYSKFSVNAITNPQDHETATDPSHLLI